MPLTRTTPALSPASAIVFVRTMWSYCSVDPALARDRRRRRAASAARRSASAARREHAARNPLQRRRGPRAPASAGDRPAPRRSARDSARRRRARRAACTRSRSSSVTSPIRTACRSHFSKMRSTSASRPRLTMRSMRSCDSDSMISYGVMPVSRCGTCATSISTPTPPRDAGLATSRTSAPPRPCPARRRRRRSPSPRGTPRAGASP